ncbi:MAG: ribosome biogenesis GTP-binding protein YihA/YsxC [Vicinamibacterales bacterium]
MKASAAFVTSAADAAGLPREGLPELAMVGRSNVGKSSLINALVRQKIARTSAEPGKTRLVNFFRVTAGGGPPFFLVDLPGYGYARGASEQARRGLTGAKGRAATSRAFEAATTAYFRARTVPGAVPASVLLLVDSRHPGLEVDRVAWSWLVDTGLACHVVATKVDKLTRAERQRHLRALETAHDGPVTAVSAATGEGLDELWRLIVRLLRQPPPETAPAPPTR